MVGLVGCLPHSIMHFVHSEHRVGIPQATDTCLVVLCRHLLELGVLHCCSRPVKQTMETCGFVVLVRRDARHEPGCDGALWMVIHPLGCQNYASKYHESGGVRAGFADYFCCRIDRQTDRTSSGI